MCFCKITKKENLKSAQRAQDFITCHFVIHSNDAHHYKIHLTGHYRWCKTYFLWYYSDRELTHPLWQLHQACRGMSGLLQCTNLQRHFSSTLQSPCNGICKCGSLQCFCSIMWNLTFGFMLTLTSARENKIVEHDLWQHRQHVFWHLDLTNVYILLFT